jgi:predicted nuclease of predicted toxin-antitoxin system
MAANASKSRKQFGASSPSKLPERPVFFLDRSLGKHKVANALRKAGVSVEVHEQHFAPDAPDREWLKTVGERSWVVLTKDQKIRYHSREREALLTSGVRAFILTAGSVSAEEMAQAFLVALPRMEKFLSKHQGPFIVAVRRVGTLHVMQRV